MFVTAFFIYYFFHIRSRLPPMFLGSTHAMETSLYLEKEKSRSKTSAVNRGVYWIVFLQSFRVHLECSRIVQYGYNVFQLILSFGLMYSDPQAWVTLSIVVLFPYLIVVNIGVVVFLGKKFRIQDL